MRILNFTTLIAFAALTTLAWGQANVNEGSETLYLYVDGTHGSDSNSGAKSAPFKTVSKGVSAALAKSSEGTGTNLTILPGTYRESVTAQGSSTAAVTVQAQTAGTVIMSGADVWTGWQEYSGNSSIYTHSWPYSWGACPAIAGAPSAANILLRREMIIVNGTFLTQVLSLAQMEAGTFYVNESSQTVYIWPPSGTTMSSATVEVATRPGLLTLEGVQSWVIRGITFQYANSCFNTDGAAVFITQSAKNILVDDDSFLWNNAIGLFLADVTDTTVESSTANHNGQIGMMGQYIQDGLWESDQASYNNWRGAQASFYTWANAGIKFGQTHNSSLIDSQTTYNEALGTHFDTDIQNITITSLNSIGNLRSGLQIEAAEGPVTIRSSEFCGSNEQAAKYDGGLNLVDAASVSMSASTLYNNGTGEIVVQGRVGGIAVKNFVTGETTQVLNKDFTNSSNRIEAIGSQQLFIDAWLTQDWDTFSESMSSSNNTWWNASDSSSFTVPVPKDRTLETFSEWKSLTSQDSSSSYSNPNISCGASADPGDYWLTVNSSSNTVSPGGTTSYVLTAVPLTFSGTISLKADVSGVPGATASLSPQSIGSSGSSTLTVKTSSSTPAGSYQVTVIANSGSVSHSVTTFLVVN